MTRLLVGVLVLGLLANGCGRAGWDADADGAAQPASPPDTHVPIVHTSMATPVAAVSSPLAATVAQVLREAGGTYGIVLEDQATGERVEHNSRRVFRSASVYKLAVACEALRRVDGARLDLADALVIGPEDAIEGEPAGGPGPGDALTVREGLRAMLAVSSNTAAHALLRRLDRSQFNAAIQMVGLRATRVPIEPDEYSVTTPADMAHLLGLLARGEILSDASRRELRELLALPKPLDPLADALPPRIPVFSKTGDLESATNVAGLIEVPTGTVTLSIFSEDVDPGAARQTIGEVARAVYAAYR
jgi:beta-lactamase class A